MRKSCSTYSAEALPLLRLLNGSWNSCGEFMPETDNLRIGFKLAVNRRFYCRARYNSVFMLVMDAKGTQNLYFS